MSFWVDSMWFRPFQWNRNFGTAPTATQTRVRATAHARLRLDAAGDSGRHSIVDTGDGWTWKFDDQLFSRLEFGENMHEDLARLRCRVGVIYGEDSDLFTQEIADFMFRVLDESVPFVAIPEARHHLFLDQPLAFVSALRTLLAEWRHSRPNRIRA